MNPYPVALWAFDAIDQGTSRYDSQKNIDAAEAAYKLEIDPDRRAAAEALFHALDERRERRKGYRRRQRSANSRFSS